MLPKRPLTPIISIHDKKLKKTILDYIRLKNTDDLKVYSRAKRFLLKRRLEKEKDKLEGYGLSMVDGAPSLRPLILGFGDLIETMFPQFEALQEYSCVCCALDKDKYKLTNVNSMSKILTEPQKL